MRACFFFCLFFSFLFFKISDFEKRSPLAKNEVGVFYSLVYWYFLTELLVLSIFETWEWGNNLEGILKTKKIQSAILYDVYRCELASLSTAYM